MKKESWTLLWVWNAFIPVHTFNKEEYVALFAFKEAIKWLEQEKENLSELNRKQSKAFKETMKDYRGLLRDYMKSEEENKKLKEELRYYKEKTDFLNKVIVKYQEEK